MIECKTYFEEKHVENELLKQFLEDNGYSELDVMSKRIQIIMRIFRYSLTWTYQILIREKVVDPWKSIGKFSVTVKDFKYYIKVLEGRVPKAFSEG